MDTVLPQYVSTEEEPRRRDLLAQHLGHEPTEEDWHLMEGLRSELIRFGNELDDAMTVSDICRLTGLSRSRIDRMREQGQFPEPFFFGRARWWKREAIEAWWTEYQCASPPPK